MAALGVLSCPAAEKGGSKAPPGKAKAVPKAPAKPAKTPVPEVPLYKTPDTTILHLAKVLPHTVEKLTQRKPVHVVVIGDDLVRMTARDATDGNALLAWPGQFVNELAREFFYPGGVRLIQPEKGRPEKLFDTRGAEITMRVFSVKGGTMQKAMALLSTYGAEAPPDLLIVGFGLFDELSGADLMSYAKSLHQVIDIMKPREVDMLLTGPMPNLRQPVSLSLGASRAYAGMANDTAVEAGVAFADLSNLGAFVQFGPDEPASAEKALGAIAHQCNDFFLWGDVFDPLIPKAAMHQKAGQMAYRVLAGLAPSVPWQITTTSIVRADAERCMATVVIENTSRAKMKLDVTPLQLPRWKPQDSATRIELKAREKKEIKLVWQRANDAPDLRFPTFAGHEAVLRLPLLITGAGTARVEEASAEVQPLAVLWKLDTLFNQEGSVTIDNVVINTTTAELKDVRWTAEWNGQKKQGTAQFAPGANTTLGISFDLPKTPSPRRVASPLTLEMTVNGGTLRWERAMEASQNFGINEEIALQPVAKGKGTVTMEAKAEKDALKLVMGFAGIDLQADASGNAVRADLNLDARSYGSRLTLGSTERITITAPAVDGPAMVGRIAPWAFGTGYGMKFDNEGVSATLETQGSHRQLVVSLPRSYLYRHEWAVGNGNSQFGINTRLAFASKEGSFTPDNTWSLTLNGKHGDDAEGLAVLELTDKPTTRWTVVVW
ncbi:MAG: hypothetical protein JNM99_23335 [Verrucomicrobiaceae bacterium]|nr:hypothetical protein [Verrucomicrobiaceae bacterium]